MTITFVQNSFRPAHEERSLLSQSGTFVKPEDPAYLALVRLISGNIVIWAIIPNPVAGKFAPNGLMTARSHDHASTHKE